MDGPAMLVDGLAFPGRDGAVRCGLPAEAEAWPIDALSAPESRPAWSVRSSDGWELSRTGAGHDR